MDEPSHEPLMTWQSIRTYAVRIVIGLVLATSVYWTNSVYSTYQRERRIARKVEWQYCGPNWVPQSVRDHLMFLNRIVTINLDETDPSAELLSELGSLTGLQRLALRNTQFTDVGLEQLKGMTSLKDLELDKTQVTDAGLEHIKGLTHLEYLNLSDTQVTDAGVEHLKGLNSLRSLNLDGTQVTDAGVEHLKVFTDLFMLLLQSTQVTDASLQHLKTLAKLESLYLFDTNTTKEGRASLRQMIPNCRIVPNP